MHTGHRASSSSSSPTLGSDPLSVSVRFLLAGSLLSDSSFFSVLIGVGAGASSSSSAISQSSSTSSSSIRLAFDCLPVFMRRLTCWRTLTSAWKDNEIETPCSSTKSLTAVVNSCSFPEEMSVETRESSCFLPATGRASFSSVITNFMYATRFERSVVHTEVSHDSVCLLSTSGILRSLHHAISAFSSSEGSVIFALLTRAGLGFGRAGIGAALGRVAPADIGTSEPCTTAQTASGFFCAGGSVNAASARSSAISSSVATSPNCAEVAANCCLFEFSPRARMAAISASLARSPMPLDGDLANKCLRVLPCEQIDCIKQSRSSFDILLFWKHSMQVSTARLVPELSSLRHFPTFSSERG
mmetsp:Transcript_104375/g.156317  ORF Transcript_104375/g.156317 Transcript_104375/m.156317 type:complete len:358 (+) Transcript_104375:1571-2644(+)